MSLTTKQKIERQIKRPEFVALDEKFRAIRPIVMGVGTLWKEYHIALKAHYVFHTAVIPAKNWEEALYDFYKRLLPFYPQLKFEYED